VSRGSETGTEARGRTGEAEAIGCRLREGGTLTAERLVALADDLGVRQALGADLEAHAHQLRCRAEALAQGQGAAGLAEFVRLLPRAAGVAVEPGTD
jgi:hypothetical protein